MAKQPRFQSAFRLFRSSIRRSAGKSGEICRNATDSIGNPPFRVNCRRVVRTRLEVNSTTTLIGKSARLGTEFTVRKGSATNDAPPSTAQKAAPPHPDIRRAGTLTGRRAWHERLKPNCRTAGLRRPHRQGPAVSSRPAPGKCGHGGTQNRNPTSIAPRGWLASRPEGPKASPAVELPA
jgi:hypothetical protein